MAPSCFALQVPDVKGFQNWCCHVLPFLAQISLTQRNTYIDVTMLDRGLVPKPFGFSQELQCNGSYLVTEHLMLPSMLVTAASKHLVESKVSSLFIQL